MPLLQALARAALPIDLPSAPNSPLVAVTKVSFVVPAGTSCAVVGHSGSGKSTLTLALTGMIPVLSGRILVDGQDLKDLPTSKLRASMAVVPQEPAVFKGAPPPLLPS
jgi:ABC-type multidrug transport system fused ATPase/permease subunit